MLNEKKKDKKTHKILYETKKMVFHCSILSSMGSID